MLCLSEFDVFTLPRELKNRGLPPVHARRILREFYRANGEGNFDTISIGNAARAWLRENVRGLASRILQRHLSPDGTIKLLVRFDEPSSGAAECVLMPSHRPDRAAACVSSQIGCAMGCDFCASTRNGLQRNLTSGEIVEQFLHLSREATSLNRRIRSLVFMGMGEPMHNLDAVVGAIRRIAEPQMGALGFRAITVSTVGIVPGIDRLAKENLGVHLALSLHAPDDETRSRLVPVNRQWKVRDILDAAKRFQHQTGRPVNIEYCLLAGVNDSDEQATLLARLVRDWRVHVNLIPYNSIGSGMSSMIYSKPSDEQVDRFASILRTHGVVTHTRLPRGDTISAACGQLRLASRGSAEPRPPALRSVW